MPETKRNIQSQVQYNTEEIEKIKQGIAEPIPGPQGPQGEQGIQGIQGERGSGVYGPTSNLPSSSDYKENDLYFLIDGSVYRHNGNQWVLRANYKGAKGNPGPAGGTEVIANPATTTDTLTGIKIDGVGYAVSGSGATYTAGDGIVIANNVISIDDDEVATHDYVDEHHDSTKQNKYPTIVFGLNQIVVAPTPVNSATCFTLSTTQEQQAIFEDEDDYPVIKIDLSAFGATAPVPYIWIRRNVKQTLDGKVVHQFSFDNSHFWYDYVATHGIVAMNKIGDGAAIYEATTSKYLFVSYENINPDKKQNKLTAGTGITINNDVISCSIDTSVAHFDTDAADGTLTTDQLNALSADPNSYIKYTLTGDILHKIEENSNVIVFTNNKVSTENIIHFYRFRVTKSDRHWTITHMTDWPINSLGDGLAYDTEQLELDYDVVQKKLIAGDNISVDDDTSYISFTGSLVEQYDLTGTTGTLTSAQLTKVNNKPRDVVFKLSIDSSDRILHYSKAGTTKYYSTTFTVGSESKVKQAGISISNTGAWQYYEDTVQLPVLRPVIEAYTTGTITFTSLHSFKYNAGATSASFAIKNAKGRILTITTGASSNYQITIDSGALYDKSTATKLHHNVGTATAASQCAIITSDTAVFNYSGQGAYDITMSLN